MDNHFVPNLTFGPTMVEAPTRSTDVPPDAHLMIEDADSNALAYVEAGCGSVTFHVEAAKAPVRLAERSVRTAPARRWRSSRRRRSTLRDLLPELDMLLVMTVEPGFGGQKFLDLCLPKIRRARELMDKHGVETWLQVDGGSRWRRSSAARRPVPTFRRRLGRLPADDPDRMVAARPGRGCHRLTHAAAGTVIWSGCSDDRCVPGGWGRRIPTRDDKASSSRIGFVGRPTKLASRRAVAPPAAATADTGPRRCDAPHGASCQPCGRLDPTSELCVLWGR